MPEKKLRAKIIQKKICDAENSQRGVVITKHFEPKVIYNNQRVRDPILPEVNADIDIIENIDKKPRESSSKTSQTKMVPAKAEIVNILNTVKKPSVSNVNRNRQSSLFKSKSCEEKKFIKPSTAPEKSLKSKSFEEKKFPKLSSSVTTNKKSYNAAVNNKKLSKKLISVSNNSNLQEHSNKSINSDYVLELKKEIQCNKLHISKSEPNSESASSRTTRLEKIRKEIESLINVKVNEKNLKMIELKTEIAAFRNDAVVYNLREEINRTSEISNSTDETPTDSTPIRENANGVQSEPSSSTICESTTEDSVSKKIEKANQLINKVKETLYEIKSKRKLKYAHSISSNSETDSTTADHEDLPLDRPKTRRKEDDDVEVADKFKTTYEKSIEAYNLLQAKLNTITESSETDESAGKKAVSKNLEDKLIQTEKNVATSSTQYESIIPLDVKETQTDLKLLFTCVNNFSKCTGVYSKTQQYPEEYVSNQLQKNHNLNVQMLPPISITAKLSIEKPFVFYINPQGVTIIVHEGLRDNMGLFLYQRDERRASLTPTVVLVKSVIEEAREAENSDSLKVLMSTDAGLHSVNEEKCRGVSFIDTDSFSTALLDKEEENEEMEDDQDKKPLSPSETIPNKEATARSHENIPKNSIKSLILRSFQTKSDFKTHSPSNVEDSAMEWAEKCDPLFYKTFINPEGIQNFTKKVSPLNLNGQSKGVQVNLKRKSDVHKTSEDFEKYSFSISFSDEITPEESNSADKHSTYSNATLVTIEDRQFRQSSTSSRKSTKSLKVIKNKMEKEHPEFFEDDIILKMSKQNQSEQPTQTKYSPVLNTFISGLVEQQPELIAKVLPRLHEAIAKSELSIKDSDSITSENFSKHKESFSKDDLLKNRKEENSKRNRSFSKKEDDSSKEDLSKKNKEFSVNFLTPLYNHTGDMISPLRTGKGGRYSDEKDLFFKIPPEKSRKREIKKDRRKCRNNHNMMDSSMASTITSLSEGEVKCTCSNSNGEVHPCRNTFSDTFQKNYRNGRIQKKKSYFSSWVTYYINKDMFSLNDSTSSSNK